MMQRPRKTFGALLRVRKQKENMQARVLAEVRREAAVAQRQLEELAQARRHALEGAGQLITGAFDAGEVRRYYQYERHLAERGVEKDAELRALKTRTEAERSALEAAMKGRRVVERLIERREAKWQSDLTRADQKITDEVGSTRAANLSMEGDALAGERREDT